MATYESKKYSTIPVAATQIADGSVTNAEYQFINSLSSNAQTQITALDAAKLNLAGGTITGNITITDNDHLYIGTGQDIDVFSDGSTGFIKSNDIRIQSSTGESYVTGTANGATKLFHDNVQKVETTGTGVTVAGTMAAGALQGDGTNITALNASNVSQGTLPMARLSGTLPALNGSALTNLNGSNVSSGTLPMARLSGTLPALNGSSLTNLNASNVSSGTLPMARLSGTLPALNGSSLTNLNGSNISSGTVADARISSLTASKLTGALPAIDGSNLTGVEPIPASTDSVGQLRTFALFAKSGSTPTNTYLTFGTTFTPSTYDSGNLHIATDPVVAANSYLGYSLAGSRAIQTFNMGGKTRSTQTGTWKVIGQGQYESGVSPGQNGGPFANTFGFLAQRIS